MRRRINWRWLRRVVATLSLALPAAVPLVSGSELESPDSLAAGSYRRVYVPADRPEQWPTAGQRYLPVDREEFERLITAARDRRDLAKAGAIQVANARHDLSFGDDALLHGVSFFDVVMVGELPNILPLTSSKAVVHAAYWEEPDGDRRKATFGNWGKHGNNSSLPGILVEQSGRVAIEWSMPQPNAATRLEYGLQFPPALKQQLIIDLPAESSAEVSSGRVIETEPGVSAGMTRWTFQLAPAKEHVLRFSQSTDETAQPNSMPRVAVNEAYGLAPDGMTYEGVFRFHTIPVEAPELRFVVPRSLRIAEVTVNQASATWKIDDEIGELIVTLPRTNSPLEVSLRATGDLALSEPWKLPSVLPSGVFWTEGTSSVWVDPALELQSIHPTGARLINAVGIERKEGGEAYRLQAWSSEASTEVQLTERKPALYVERGLTNEFASSELIGRCQVRLWTVGNPVLQVEARLKPGWNVESVEDESADALAEWHVAGTDHDRRLYLQLLRSASEQDPIALKISARRPLRGGAPAAKIGELDWIAFPGAQSFNRKLVVVDRHGGDFTLSNARPGVLLPLSTLSAAERDLFATTQAGLVVAPNRASPDDVIRVEPARPSIQGAAWIELAHTATGFQHQAEIECRPVGGAVSELIVSASRPLPPDTRWSIRETSEQPSVQLVSNGADDLPAQSYRYRVRLPGPRVDAFRLHLSWRGGAEDSASINSLILPAATAWQSWAILRGDPAAATVDAAGRSPAAALPEVQDEGPPVLACLRLAEEPMVASASLPGMSLIRNLKQGASPAVTCRSLSITSLVFADGNETHQFTYDLQVHVDETIEIQPPRGFEIVAARLEGDEITLRSAESQDSKIRAPLDGGRGATLEVVLHGKRAPLDVRTNIAPLVPTTSFSVQRGNWTVAAPAPYKVESRRLDSLDWKQRIFGPLLRRPERPSSQQESTIAPATHATPTDAPIPAGWSEATQYFVTAPTPGRILRIDRFRAARHLSWLTAAVLAALIWPIRRAWVVVIWPALAIACLTLPAEWIFLPQAVLLGSVAGVVLRILLAALSVPQLWPEQKGRIVAGGTALAASLLFGADSAALAEETSSPPPAVLFPVDATGETAGEDVYVPADLLSELLSAVGRSRPGGADYVLLAAKYEIDLADDAASGDVVPGECRLRFRIKTLQDDVVVRLPLNKNDGDWCLSETTLDGKSVPLDWGADGVLAVVIPEAGSYQLTLKLRPRLTTAAGANSIAIAVPPLSGASVDVTHPASLQALTVNGMRLPSPEATKTSGQISAQATLEVAWPARQRHAAAGVVVDQLSSLHVDPATTRLDVQLRVTGGAAGLRSLELLAPANLKLMPLPEESPIVDAQIHPGVQNLIELTLRPDAAEPLTLDLQFQLQRSVSWGRLQFPLVRIMGAAGGTHLIAATVDPRLQLRESTTAGLTSIESGELERQWGSLESPPTAQFALQADADSLWTMQIEPAPLRFSPRESLELLCSADQAGVTYVADVDDVRGEHLVHHLSVPAELEISKVSVAAGGQLEGVPVRWSRPRPEKLSMFLSRPLGQRHRLRIEGRIGYDQEQGVHIPRVALEGFGASPIEVDLYRTSEVLIHATGLDGTSSRADIADNSSGLFVGRYLVDRSAPSMPRLEIIANEARYAADLLLTMELQGKTPTARLTLHGRVLEGKVDRLRLSIASDLSALRLHEPEGVAAVESSATDEGRQIVEIKMKQPVAAGEDFLVRISGDVSLSDVQLVRFPQLRLLNAERQRIYLAIPKPAGNQSAEWTRRGLQKEALPKALAGEFDKSNTLDTYRAIRDRFVAEQRIFPNDLRTPEVRLATTRVLLDARGRWSAITDLAVQPGGSLESSIKLPAGAELMQVSVDGEPILAPSMVDREFPIPLRSRFLPRRVSLAYKFAPEDHPGRFEVALPTVMISGKPAPVNQSFWQVEGLRSDEVVLEDEAAAALTASAWMKAVRKEQIDLLLDAGPIAFQLPEWELKNWCRPWLRHLESSDVVDLSPSQVRSWSQLRDRMIKLVGEAPDAEEVNAAPVAPELTIYGRGSRGGSLALTRVGRDFGIARWLLASLIGVATVLAWRHPHRFKAGLRVLERRPAVIGIAAGALWWAYFTPALLGPAIMALSVAVWLKMRRERVALRQGLMSWAQTSDSVPAAN